ncbi:FcoT-like thioesterase domain-containing protein [Lentzea xinjiangensis]|uniref:(2E)-enoyl-[ACP] glycyltransferase n=1 Tax=Lentzea xinjiangensis TaxID=402600 RepID=A0A1H9NJP1_9PSEU|nr:FcoT family thioesterase [Lentzea xinjiangensis]SER36112.1 FcoT-like thioesterase domain-containing protein [Lentzea xinjiangensis]
MKVVDRNDVELLSQVLRPYRDDCRYLQEAYVVEGAQEVTARGRFSIAESCYIDSTGHFNAVEFNICYNQLGYFLIASCVQRELLDEFAAWSMDDFWERQLSDVLIYRFASKFSRMIDPGSFTGEVTFAKPVVRRKPGRPPVMIIDTACSFWDDNGGAAAGEVTLAFTRLPG